MWIARSKAVIKSRLLVALLAVAAVGRSLRLPLPSLLARPQLRLQPRHRSMTIASELCSRSTAPWKHWRHE